jgi:hypothetical protein
VLYFAYASNMDPAQMRASCPSAELVCRSAHLSGYRLDFRRLSRRWQAGVADLVANADADVFGCVWELPEAELAALDHREGVQIGAYRRTPVALAADGRTITAFTYTVVEKSCAPVAPAARYARLILDSARELGLPLEYQAQLRAVIEGLVSV